MRTKQDDVKMLAEAYDSIYKESTGVETYHENGKIVHTATIDEYVFLVIKDQKTLDLLEVVAIGNGPEIKWKRNHPELSHIKYFEKISGLMPPEIRREMGVSMVPYDASKE
jgi:hypothetical protein